MSSRLSAADSTPAHRITVDEWYERPEPRIRTAIERDDVDQLRKILQQVKSGALREADHILYNYDRLLQLSLLRSAELGKIQAAELILKLGAKLNALPSRQSLLLRAVHRGHLDIMQLLLRYGAPVDEQDRKGMSVLMHAAINNNYPASRILVNARADIDLTDFQGKSVLHHLAADKSLTLSINLLEMLLGISDLNKKDLNGRTPLHWTCATGHLVLAKLLLEGPTSRFVDTDSRDSLGRSPLHLAVSHDRRELVSLLLKHDVDVNARSTGGWTALHIACQKAKFSGRDSGIVNILLENGASTNAQTFTGETPLHLAAESDVKSVLEHLLEHYSTEFNIRDDYGNTPFSKAIKANSTSAILLLAPFNERTLPAQSNFASQSLKATTIDFGRYPNGKRRIDRRITNFIHCEGINNIDKSLYDECDVSPKSDDATEFRWINIPSNDVSLAKALVTKALMEEVDYDIAKFTAVERTVEELERGQRFQSHYMRPSCECTSEGIIKMDTSERIINIKTSAMTFTTNRSIGSMFTVMPYVHFEPNLSISKLEDTLDLAFSLYGDSAQMILNTSRIYEQASSQYSLKDCWEEFDFRSLSFNRKKEPHVIRGARLKRQREKNSSTDLQQNLSLYMIGQLWMWILSPELIVTSIPGQWEPSKDGHLNVLESIVNDIKNKSKETAPVKSVIELASIITARCVSMFDARVSKEKDSPFFDNFESAVSSTDEEVDELFREFNSDSRQASEWLKRRGGSKTINRSDDLGDDTDVLSDDTSAEPECIDRLLDINPETKLLDRIQNLREQFQLLKTVLTSQSVLLNDFPNSNALNDSTREQFRRSTKHLLLSIQNHLRDLERMEIHINAVHASITNLLDLKHRYANVFEARFARYQAADTVHQGQTIMVFTIVTVIFLPLSFIGTLFTINISDFPQGNDGEPSMTLAYVSKWVFGIGFAISVPLVALALSYETMMRLFKERRKIVLKKWRNRKQHRRAQKIMAKNVVEEKKGKEPKEQGHGSSHLQFLRSRARLSKRSSSQNLAEV